MILEKGSLYHYTRRKDDDFFDNEILMRLERTPEDAPAPVSPELFLGGAPDSYEFKTIAQKSLQGGVTSTFWFAKHAIKSTDLREVLREELPTFMDWEYRSKEFDRLFMGKKA